MTTIYFFKFQIDKKSKNPAFARQTFMFMIKSHS